MESEEARTVTLQEFEEIRPRHQAFTNSLARLLENILSPSPIKIHVIEKRTKDLASFREKLTRPGKSYRRPFEEINDITGVRIITYYQDDVPKVLEILSQEFEIVEKELSHQPDALDADRFGYLSAHYVIKLGTNRATLREWKIYADLLAEIQVRTVIQHAWSAVSHALQYKQEAQVPSRLQRRLFRIASLFELADEEFVGIRDQKGRLSAETVEALEAGNQAVPLSVTAIEKFLEQWEHAEELLNAAASAGFDSYIFGENDYIPEIYDIAIRNGLKTVADLEQAIFPINKGFLDKLYNVEPHPWSASLDFLACLLLIQKFAKNVEPDSLSDAGWGLETAKKVVRVARESQKR